jgi:hypothetical protein
MAEQAKWRELHGWEDSTSVVSIRWAEIEGENKFRLKVTSKSSADGETVEVSQEEALQVYHEQHVYPFVAQKLGHEAAVHALGFVEPASDKIAA